MTFRSMWLCGLAALTLSTATACGTTGGSADAGDDTTPSADANGNDNGDDNGDGGIPLDDTGTTTGSGSGAGLDEFCSPSTPCAEGLVCQLVNPLEGTCVVDPTAGTDTTAGTGDDTTTTTGDDDDTTTTTDGNPTGDSCLGTGATCLDGTTRQFCDTDGVTLKSEDCSATAGSRCIGGQCTQCEPGAAQCKDAVTSQVCDQFGQAFTKSPCAAKQACNASSGRCEDSACTPNESKCIDAANASVCAADGSQEVTTKCSDLGANYECAQGKCLDPCGIAEANENYTGCSFWPVVLPNTVDAVPFHDDYAVVVSNSDPTRTANVSVEDVDGAVGLPVAVAPGEVKVIKLPWNAVEITKSTGTLPDATDGASSLTPTAYHLVSDLPVAAYQFNPLNFKIGSAFSYSNDASLLLPEHVFDKTHLAMSYAHAKVQTSANPVRYIVAPAFVTLVASGDGETNVTLNVRGRIATGGPIANVAKTGDTVTFKMKQFDVVQLVTANADAATTCVASVPSNSYVSVCVAPDSELTGTVVRTDKPIAMFGGSDCTQAPYNYSACDHIEEQIPGFTRWGYKYVASRSVPLGNGKSVDTFRIVAGVNGTTLTFQPPVPNPASASGATISSVKVNAGDVLEFRSSGSPDAFTVASQDDKHPFLLAMVTPSQYSGGISGGIFGGGPLSAVGDPSLIVLPPAEQYRKDYLFLVPNTIKDDYAIIYREFGTASKLDNVTQTASFTRITGTTYEYARIKITDGAHKLECDKPCGLIVFGLDEFVSYGYTGGLDLKVINTSGPDLPGGGGIGG
jgi:hypothetical protein